MGLIDFLNSKNPLKIWQILHIINTIINYYKLKTAEYDNKKELLAF